MFSSGSTLCLLLMTDGANSVQPNDVAEAVAAHQVQKTVDMFETNSQKGMITPMNVGIQTALGLPKTLVHSG